MDPSSSLPVQGGTMLEAQYEACGRGQQLFVDWGNSNPKISPGLLGS